MHRQKLAACLWPESSDEQARHALERLLYSTRQQLGHDLFLGVNPLRLDPAMLGSDVGDFEAALARGALAEAIALHRGPFLDGFYLNGAAAFERWTEGERTRLVLYEMLAGAPPFTGATPQVILTRQVTDPVPSIRTVCPTLSDVLEAAIMQGLARTPSDRFLTMAALAHALVSG